MFMKFSKDHARIEFPHMRKYEEATKSFSLVFVFHGVFFLFVCLPLYMNMQKLEKLPPKSKKKAHKNKQNSINFRQ